MKYENDLHLFSNKLKTILIEKGLTDLKKKPDIIALYNLLYPADTITEEQCKNDRQSVTDKTRAVANWVKGKNYPKTINDIISLCNCLDCDIDYFFTDMTAPTHDIEFISNTLNLSHTAITNLMTYDKECSELLDKMIINNDDMLKFLLSTLYTYIFSRYSTVTIENKLFDSSKTLEKQDSVNILKYDATESFKLILKLLDTIYQKDIDKIYKNNIEILKLQNEILRIEIETEKKQKGE